MAERRLTGRGVAGPHASGGVRRLAGSQGTFCMCGFWYVDCIARAGRTEEARLIFEVMLHYAGHSAPRGEGLGPTGAQRSDCPQAFTHRG